MYCGLDFGTSNSLCTVENKTATGGVKYIEFDRNERSIPSAVFYQGGKTSAPLFGSKALEAYLEGTDGRLLRSFKRLLGTKYFSSGTMLSSSKKLRFQDLFVSFVRHIKETAESQLGEELTHVVFGRPVRFSILATANKSGEKDLYTVAGQIGFKQVEFQFEPIASAFTHERKLQSEKLAVVADIGGGTSDFSVIRLGPKLKDSPDRSADILANSGIAIGGTDFDSLLSIRQVMESFGYLTQYGAKELNIPNWPYVVASDWNKIALELYLRKTYLSIQNVFNDAREPEKVKRFLTLIEKRKAHHLLKLVEEAKIELSTSPEALINPGFIEKDLQIPMNRAEFERSMKDKIRLLEDTILEAISQARLKPEKIELVIMTGGASAVPIIQKTFINLFPRAEMSAGNKLGSVCEGLLYDARRKFGARQIK